MCANLALISGIENSCHHGANYQTANMIKEADPRVGFFSILEVMVSEKERIAQRRRVGSNPTFRLRERSKMIERR